MNELFGSESPEIIEGMGMLVSTDQYPACFNRQNRQGISFLSRPVGTPRDMLPDETRLMVRIEYVSDNGTRTFRLDG